MKQLKLAIVSRNDVGRGVCNRLRAAGRIPAVIYGDSGVRSLSMDDKEFRLLLRAKGGSASIIQVIDESGKAALSILKDMQKDPLTDCFLHVDLQEVSENKEMHVTLPVHVKGEAFGVKTEGGMLVTTKMQVEVRCLPKDLPEYIEVDVTNLKVGESIHIKNLPVVSGVTYTENAEMPLISCTSGVMEEETASAGAEGAAAEGAAAGGEEKKSAEGAEANKGEKK